MDLQSPTYDLPGTKSHSDYGDRNIFHVGGYVCVVILKLRPIGGSPKVTSERQGTPKMRAARLCRRVPEDTQPRFCAQAAQNCVQRLCRYFDPALNQPSIRVVEHIRDRPRRSRVITQKISILGADNLRNYRMDINKLMNTSTQQALHISVQSLRG